MSRSALTWFENVWNDDVEVIDYQTIFLTEKIKSKSRIVWEFQCVLGIIRKLSLSLDLIEFISQFSDLRCEKYWFFSGFCCWKFKQILKIGVWKGKSVDHVCTCANGTCYTSGNYVCKIRTPSSAVFAQECCCCATVAAVPLLAQLNSILVMEWVLLSFTYIC